MSNWNGNRFSIYTSEEETTLELIEELGKQTNHNTDSLANKTDLTGDHKGSWQGLKKPTMSEEGMRATVEKIVEVDLPTINKNITDNYNELSSSLETIIRDKNWVDITTFGANPLAVDNSTFLQNAINYAKTVKKPIHIPSGVYNFNSPLLMSEHNQHYGIIGDGIDNSVLNFTGVGTAITSRGASGLYCDFQLKGDRTKLQNGIFFNFYGGHGYQRNIKVQNMNGFGVDYLAIWDSSIDNIITVNCGNADNYAFIVRGGIDTSNHTQFNRVQVELSQYKSMYIENTSLCLYFTNCHAERCENADGTTYNYVLLGDTCVYDNFRIEERENILIQVGGAYSNYANIRTNGDINCAQPNASYHNTFLKNIRCRTFKNMNKGTAIIDGLKCDNLINIGERFKGKNINVGVSFSYNIATYGIMKISDSDLNCDIKNSNTSILEIKDSIILNYIANNFSTLINCKISNITSEYRGKSNFVMCEVIESVLFSSETFLKFYSTTIKGNVAEIASGRVNYNILFDDNCVVLGTLPNYLVNAPVSNPSSFVIGDKHYNMKPTSGSYIGWVRIDGTWKGFGLIA